MAVRDVVIASNRGPVSFELGEDGVPVARRGGGGLASGLRSLTESPGTVWISAAMTAADRVAVDHPSAAEAGVRLLDIDPADYRSYYDTISNETLWFLHHHLFDLTREPAIGEHWRTAWTAYERVNAMFADAIAEVASPGSVVLVQDYHLSLVGRRLRSLRPDLVTVHFHHTPFAEPTFLRALPRAFAAELVGALAAYSACGFHTRRWRDDFVACCDSLAFDPPHTFVAPLGVDVAALAETATSDAVVTDIAELEAIIGDRAFIVRVDRMELSKNLVRGFLAYDELLERHPEWRERVVFGAFCYPSRENVEAYRRYHAEVVAAVEAVNDRWGTPGWTPILLETGDDYERSVAALCRYDVLVVNPIRDGLNLVAKEGPAINRRHGTLVLSTEAGSAAEMSHATLPVNPFDVSELADRLHIALGATAAERSEMAAVLAHVAVERTAERWLDDQLAAAEIASTS